MIGYFRSVTGFFVKEFKQALRDPVMKLFILVVPVIQLMVLGFAIDNEFKNLRLAVKFSPDDVLMRQLSENLFSSGWFKEVYDKSLPEEIMRRGTADAVLVAPIQGLSRAVIRNEAVLQLLIDGKNATKARAVERYVQSAVQLFLMKQTDVSSGNRLRFALDIRLLFNPAGVTAFFMVPGIMTMIICLVTIMLTGMSIAREKEMGTFESIIASPLSNTEIILGKTVPFVTLGIIDAFLVILFGTLIFGMPVRGSLFILAVATLIFVSTTVSIGMLLSTFARNQQQAMMGAFLFLFPANLLSGVFFPIENMPKIIQLAAYVNPLLYFVRILRNVMLKGANPGMVWTNIAILCIFGLFVITATVNRFRQTLN